MTQDPNSSNNQSPQASVDGLSQEVVDNIKHSILPGVGYKRPPAHSRFKKGRSGNPNGCPKKEALLEISDRSANALALRESDRQISVREGGEVRTMTTIEAIFRALSASALKGNAHAQWRAIDRYDQAQRERQQMIAREVEVWQYYVEQKRKEMAEAAAQGNQIPAPLPHPDDVVIDHETGVRFIGPICKKDLERMNENLAFRDALLLQDALDNRLFECVDDRLDGPGTAYLFAYFLNLAVPKRFRLSDGETANRIISYGCLPKRELLKRTYQAWRALGKDVRRGRTSPPLRWGKSTVEQISYVLSEAVAKL